MRRREPGPAELEALDPLSGETLSSAASPTDATTARPRRLAVRRQRLRRLALLATFLAAGFAAAAAYFAVSIGQLRGVERTWREAMALDAARADGDRRVRALLEAAAPGEDTDPSTLAPLGAIGTEVAGGLRRHERGLADRRILDSKVSALRDAMVAALEFRRFQLSPTRDRMGDTPLQQVESTIEEQLDRWGLGPSAVDEPELASVKRALAQLRRHGDVRTGAILFALDGTTLHTIDVDRSRRHERRLASGGELVAVRGGVAVIGGGRLDVYSPDPDAPLLAAIEADVVGAVPAGDSSGDLWIAQRGGTVIRRFSIDGRRSSGWRTDPATLPPGRTLVGSTSDHLVLAAPEGGLELWSPSLTGPGTTLASRDARFLDADGAFVLFQGPLPFNPHGGSAFLHRYHVGAARSDLIGLPRTEAASAEIGPDSTAAIAAGPLAGRLGSILLLPPDGTALLGAASGPRVSVVPGSIAWAHDGASLFWLTPDGAIAIAHGEGLGTRLPLRAGLRGLDRLVAIGR